MRYPRYPILPSALRLRQTPRTLPTTPPPPQPPTDDQYHLAAWFTSRTSLFNNNLRHCLDCPPEVTVASPSNLVLHYYDHHAPQTCRFCNASYHGNLEGGAHIKAHHPQQWESFSASKKLWWARACDQHHFRLKIAPSERAFRMVVERRRWASELRAKVGEAHEGRVGGNSWSDQAS